MKNDKKINFIKTNINDFLNENNISDTTSDNTFKRDDVMFYKNQYMKDSEKVIISNVEEYTDGEIANIDIKFNDNRKIRLLPYEFKYLSKIIKKSLYDIVKDMDNQISNIIGYTPKQTYGLLEFLNSSKNIDVININFTEEIKDGRSSKFDINLPLKLENKILKSNGFDIKILNIKFDKRYNQDSDYNEYIDYTYKTTIEKI